MTTPAPARIFGIVACEANQAIILRRGPTRLAQLLVWDLNSDTVTPGQWIRANVYVRKFDVSPNGRYMVGAFTDYSAQYRQKKGPADVDPFKRTAWTAISRPPYFTAVGLWWNTGTWNGGGVWRDNSKVEIYSTWELDEYKLPGPPIKVSRHDPKQNADEDPLFSHLLKKRGWEQVQNLIVETEKRNFRKMVPTIKDAVKAAELHKFVELGMEVFRELIPRYRVDQVGVWERSFDRGLLRRFDNHSSEEYVVIDDQKVVQKRWKTTTGQPHWVDLDAAGNLIFAEKGCLWRWTDFPTGEPIMVADLNSNHFENVAPPDWAKMT